MKKILYTLKNKFTLVNVLTIISTIAFTVLTAQLCYYFFDILPVKNGLEIADISFISLIATFRFIIRIILQHYIKDNMTINVSDLKVSFADKDTVAPSGSNSGQESSGKDSSNMKKKPTNYEGMDNLTDNYHSTLKTMLESAHGLNKLKIKNNLIYVIDSNGGLQMDVPKSISDEEANILAEKVSDLDSQYIASLDRYNKL